jgi:hypothetical protein
MAPTGRATRRWSWRALAIVGITGLLVGLGAGAGLGRVLARRDGRAELAESLRQMNGPHEEPKTDVIVFLTPATAEATVAGLTDRVRSDPGIRAACYVTQDEALDEFRVLFADSPEMTGSVTAELLPPSFRIDVGGHREEVARVEAEYRTLPGVKEVVAATPGGTNRELLSMLEDGNRRAADEGRRWDCEGSEHMVVG